MTQLHCSLICIAWSSSSSNTVDGAANEPRRWFQACRCRRARLVCRRFRRCKDPSVDNREERGEAAEHCDNVSLSNGVGFLSDFGNIGCNAQSGKTDASASTSAGPLRTPAVCGARLLLSTTAPYFPAKSSSAVRRQHVRHDLPYTVKSARLFFA